MTEFDWKKFDYLGHKFIKKHKNEYDNNSYWSVCLNCGVFVYINIDSHFADEIRFWDDDLFHDKNGFSSNAMNVGVVKFNLTCNEVLIKKLLE